MARYEHLQVFEATLSVLALRGQVSVQRTAHRREYIPEQHDIPQLSSILWQFYRKTPDVLHALHGKRVRLPAAINNRTVFSIILFLPI